MEYLLNANCGIRERLRCYCVWLDGRTNGAYDPLFTIIVCSLYMKKHWTRGIALDDQNENESEEAINNMENTFSTYYGMKINK